MSKMSNLVKTNDLTIMVKPHLMGNRAVCIACKGSGTRRVYDYRNPNFGAFQYGIIARWHYEKCLSCDGRGHWRVYND